jgi:hypothetical protein
MAPRVEFSKGLRLLKTVTFLTKDLELISRARVACESRGIAMLVEAAVGDALSAAAKSDLFVVDLIATLDPPHRISGYMRFADALMSSAAAEVPLVLIGAPQGYRLDGMVGWPGFLAAFVDRPIVDGTLHFLLDYA